MNRKITKLFGIMLLGAVTPAAAQISFGVKANLLFPTGSPSWKNIVNTSTQAYREKGKNNAGYNVGLSLKAPLPGSLFIMPELYYTSFKNEFTDPVTNTTLEARNNRIDLPVLLGYNLLGETLGVFAGPVASYNLSTDNQFDDFRENAKNQFTLGYQFGGQIQFRKLSVNARYEGAFTQDQRDYIQNLVNSSNYNVRYDNRPSMFIVGVGYRF